MTGDLFVIANTDGAHAPSGDDLRSHLARRHLNGAVKDVGFAAVAVADGSPDARSVRLEVTLDHITGLVAQSALGAAAAETNEDSASLGWEAAHVRVTCSPGQVIVTNDGLGALPFYWCIRGGRFVGATQLGAVVALVGRPQWDEAAVLEYLALLHPLGERTLIEGIHALPAGARLAVSAHTHSLTTRPLYCPREAEEVADDAALDRFAQAWRSSLENVVEHAAGRRLGVGLSGGLDSRAVASGLASVGLHPLSYTYGSPPQREAVVAARVAARLNMPHLEIPLGDERLMADLQRTVRVMDGAHSPAEFYDAWMLPQLLQSIDVAVSGLWGGPLWGGDKGMGLDRPAVAADAYVDRVSGAIASATGFTRSWNDAAARAAVREDALAGLARWGSRADLSVFWNVDNRQRRWGLMLPVAMGRLGLQVEAPFLNSRVVTALAALSPDQRRNGRLHLKAHRAQFADVSDIARSNDGNAPDHLDHVYWSADESVTRQLWHLTRRHPFSAARRVSTQGAARLVNRVSSAAVADRLANRLASRHDVFAPSLLVRRPLYRYRLRRYLLDNLDSLPGFLRPDPLRSAAVELVEGRALTDDPLVLARVASVGAWAKLWT